MASRDPRGRLLVVSCALGLGYASFVGCGSTDGKRDVRREDGGAGGEAGETPSGARPSAGTNAGGNMTSGGNGGSGVIPLGGAGGEPPVVGGGTGGSTPIGGTTGGTAVELGGAGGEAGSPTGSGGEPAGGAVNGGDNAGGEAGSGPTACVPTQGSRITLGFDANNAEWVNNLVWLDSTDTPTANLVASGGNGLCGEPTEFFGQAYGAPEGTTPGIVVAGSRATRSPCGLDVTLVSTPNNCGGTAQIPWETEYHFYGGAKADQLRITRTFGFDESTTKFSGFGLRPWQPRVRKDTFTNVIYPNGEAAGITTVNVNTCPGDCFSPPSPPPSPSLPTTWAGEWFADITATGLALIVRRDPAMTAPVALTVNYDSFSSGNLSSIVLVQPADGWKAPITEVEYLCMADLTTWPQAERDAAQLPAFCGP